MPATLMLRQEERRLAGPTEAMSAGPDRLVSATPLLEDPLDADVDGVTAVVDQASVLVQRNPRSSAARARLAHAQLAAGRNDDARRTAREVLANKAAIDDAPSLVAAATVLASVGDVESAEGALALLGGRRFPHLFARLAADRNEWDTALARLDGFSDSPSRELRGWIEIQRHRYREAVQSYRAVIATSDSASPDLYVNLGYAYAALGSLRKAIRATKAALVMSPGSRTAGFNLAAFQIAAGDNVAALSALGDIRRHHPDELAPVLAIASALARAGELKEAERELRQAEQSTWWGAGPVERATIKANLVAVRQARGQVTPADAYGRVRTILEKIDYNDLGIARLLLWWMYSTKQAGDAKKLLQELGRRFPAQLLGAFRTQEALLRLDFDRAINEARRWTNDEPFDTAAVTNLTYLLLEARDAFEEAVRIGRNALQRFPSEIVVRNNVAYGLVQLGRLDEALKTLAYPSCVTDPVCMATLGLLRLRQGRIDEGLTLYQRAAETAGKSSPILADMIRQRAAVEADNFGRKVDLPVGIAQRNGADPRFLLTSRRSGQSMTLPSQRE